MSIFIGIKMVNSLLPFNYFRLNKLEHTCYQFACDVNGKNTKQSVLNQGTYRSLVYPFIYIETQNGKAPTSVLLFYCFETVKGLDTFLYFLASQ